MTFGCDCRYQNCTHIEVCSTRNACNSRHYTLAFASEGRGKNAKTFIEKTAITVGPVYFHKPGVTGSSPVSATEKTFGDSLLKRQTKHELERCFPKPASV